MVGYARETESSRERERARESAPRRKAARVNDAYALRARKSATYFVSLASWQLFWSVHSGTSDTAVRNRESSARSLTVSVNTCIGYLIIFTSCNRVNSQSALVTNILASSLVHPYSNDTDNIQFVTDRDNRNGNFGN